MTSTRKRKSTSTPDASKKVKTDDEISATTEENEQQQVDEQQEQTTEEDSPTKKIAAANVLMAFSDATNGEKKDEDVDAKESKEWEAVLLSKISSYPGESCILSCAMVGNSEGGEHTNSHVQWTFPGRDGKGARLLCFSSTMASLRGSSRHFGWVQLVLASEFACDASELRPSRFLLLFGPAEPLFFDKKYKQHNTHLPSSKHSLSNDY
eukprot:scaffold2132_cov152-Skeletonema_menzelii.AAC.6